MVEIRLVINLYCNSLPSCFNGSPFLIVVVLMNKELSKNDCNKKVNEGLIFMVPVYCFDNSS